MRINVLQEILRNDSRTKDWILKNEVESKIDYISYEIIIDNEEKMLNVVNMNEVRNHLYDYLFERFEPIDDCKVLKALKNYEQNMKMLYKMSFKELNSKNLISIENLIEIKISELDKNCEHLLLLITEKPSITLDVFQNFDYDENKVIEIGIQCAEGLGVLHENNFIYQRMDVEGICIKREKGETFYKLNCLNMILNFLKDEEEKLSTESIKTDRIEDCFFYPPTMPFECYMDKKFFSSDVFSLAMILYWLCNECVFPDEYKIWDIIQLKKSIVLRKPINCSNELWKILKRALEFDYKKRYQTAEEFKERLLLLKNSN